MPEPPPIRPAREADAPAVAAIFNQGIAGRSATFETRDQRPERFAALITSDEPLLVAERGDGAVVGFAKIGPYDDSSHYYAGIGEATVYVERSARRAGTGRALLEALTEAARDRGRHKLTAKVFADNGPSIALFRACGWREVGVHLRHGRLEGEWKDVLVLERSLGDPEARA